MPGMGDTACQPPLDSLGIDLGRLGDLVDVYMGIGDRSERFSS